MTAPTIELIRLHRYYGPTKAVNDVSFSVNRGTVFGYIGPNGAGKTTSMRILSTLELPTSGDARIDGFSSVNDPDRVRKRLGFMPDAFGAYANMNCHEYLDFFARAHGLVGRERHLACHRVMGFTGVDKMAEKPIRGLSKGMKQRLCLGRALIHDPPVLILDEPAAGLDPRARIELRNMIGQLAADGKTVLVSSHILSELAEMCDQVGIIEGGQLLAVGTVDEIQHGRVGDTPRKRQIRIRVAEDGAVRLEKDLATRDQVEDLRRDGEQLYFSHGFDRDFEVKLLKHLVESGYPIAEFATHTATLEDAFLMVTEGIVQ